VAVTERSIQGWLPGAIELAEPLKIPSALPPGSYELALAIVHPNTETPAVRLAIEGRAPDGWYPLSRIAVRTD
jgi:hypothetical protein